MFALQRDRRQLSPDDFPEQLAELLAYLEDDFPPDHPFARLAALPGAPGRPDVWLLGSSPQSAIWAGELGLPYSIADFINPRRPRTPGSTASASSPRVAARTPELAVCVSAICAETDEEAERLAASAAHGDHAAPPRAPDPGAVGRDGARVPRGARRSPACPGRRVVVGSPRAVRAGLEEVAAEYGPTS